MDGEGDPLDRVRHNVSALLASIIYDYLFIMLQHGGTSVAKEGEGEGEEEEETTMDEGKVIVDLDAKLIATPNI